VVGTPDEGINLDLEVSTDSLQSGGLGIELSLGNSDGWVSAFPLAEVSAIVAAKRVSATVSVTRQNPAQRNRSPYERRRNATEF
jgi:hypothetical protein